VAAANTEPKLALRQVARARDAAANAWNIRWQVDNLGSDGLKIVSARLPHGQFKSDEQHFEPPLELAGGESKEFQNLVRCQEPAGLVTENAFVIFHCHWRGEAWRIFVRLRVTVKANGEPETATELVTTQKVGFSGLSD
jgi:hypothetical protein